VKIATWNVNSVRARLERVLSWLRKEEPEILCLQELKCRDEHFPYLPFEEIGYRCAVYGQKTYNGVAILGRTEPREIKRGMNDGTEDPEARLISASFGDVRVLSAYVPNGRVVGSDAYDYKLAWLDRLRRHLERHWSPEERLVLCGDFNVAPDDTDVAHPEMWAETVLCHEEARRALRQVVDWGLSDILRLRHPEGGVFTWWDYRLLSFPKNDGLRLDHIFATKPLAAVSQHAWVDREERKGKKPSDHAPVLAVFNL